MKGAGGTYRGAGVRRRGLAGLRDAAPSEARGADGERAGRRTPAHTAAGPNAAAGNQAGEATPELTRRPEHPWATQQHSTGGAGPQARAP